MILENMFEVILVGVATTALSGALGYLVYSTRRIVTLLDRHDRALFGETGMNQWAGLVELEVENRKCVMENRRAILTLTDILIRDGILKPDKNLEEILSVLRVCQPCGINVGDREK